MAKDHITSTRLCEIVGELLSFGIRITGFEMSVDQVDDLYLDNKNTIDNIAKRNRNNEKFMGIPIIERKP